MKIYVIEENHIEDGYVQIYKRVFKTAKAAKEEIMRWILWKPRAISSNVFEADVNGGRTRFTVIKTELQE